MIFELAGGIGLFLLGMTLLTDGLKAFAGDALRHALLRFTGRPVTAFVSGAVVTAMVQSSSATTLATIGFVSAGLIGFSQSVGIVIGASLGTTGTGWIVSTVGLKLSMTTLALPMVGIGAFAHLLARGRTAAAGLALAGFGLIFIGIDFLQAGMEGLSGLIDLSQVPSRGLWGHALMLIIGVVMTVIMQSSSAAVATTLTALHGGAIDFEQAASLVIGQAIGTTVTAAIAAIGATTAAKRTALAHIIFNATTGVIALVFLPLYLWLLEKILGSLDEAGAVALAAFHTSFILGGVIIFLPFASRFAALIERVLPEKESAVTRYLDRSLMELPAVAMAAAGQAMDEVVRQVLVWVDWQCLRLSQTPELSFADLDTALNEVRSFVTAIPVASGEDKLIARRVELMHALDHLGQLLAHEGMDKKPLSVILDNQELRAVCHIAADAIDAAVQVMNSAQAETLANLEQISTRLAGERKRWRVQLLAEIASGNVNPPEAIQWLDHIRKLDSAVFHLWRAITHLKADAGEQSAVNSPSPQEDIDLPGG